MTPKQMRKRLDDKLTDEFAKCAIAEQSLETAKQENKVLIDLLRRSLEYVECYSIPDSEELIREIKSAIEAHQ